MKGRKCVLVRQPPVESQLSAGSSSSGGTFCDVRRRASPFDTKPEPDASNFRRYTIPIHHGCTSTFSLRFRKTEKGSPGATHQQV